MAKLFVFLCLFLTVVAGMLVGTTKAEDKVCFDRFLSKSAESCANNCKANYKDHLLKIFPPNPPFNTKCICEFSCYQDKDDCVCPF